MNNPLISVLVPCYNVSPWLHRCLDSILAQTYTNWEAILVNDGSKDNTADILEEYEMVGDSIWQKFNASKDDELLFYNEFLKVIKKKHIPERMKIDMALLVDRLKSAVNQE